MPGVVDKLKFPRKTDRNLRRQKDLVRVSQGVWAQLLDLMAYTRGG